MSYLDDNGNPIAAPAKTYLDPNTGEPMSAAPAAAAATAAPQEGFWHSLGSQLGMTPEAAEAVRQHILAHPVEALLGGPAVAAVKGAAQGFMRSTGELGQAVDALREGNPAAAGVHAATAIPFLGPALDKGSDQYLAGNYAGEIGSALGGAVQAAPAVLGAMDEALPGRPTVPNPSVGPAVRRVIAGDVNAPIPGTDVTPAARYASMQNMGIQPNAAEATNSPVLKGVQKVNENSLTSAQTYKDAQAQNLDALNDYTKHVVDSMSPLNPEEGGTAVQQALLKSHADLKQGATEAYKDLDKQAGTQPVAGTAALRQQAQAILDANRPYYTAHPELEPTKAMAIVRDLAGAKRTAPTPAVVTGFGPAAPESVATAPPDMTYSELHRLRSDLLDFNNTNPDLVKNQANGWISQLAGAADKAITSSEGSLSPEQVETFRNANDAWKTLKDTYDNPSHPFYQAVRTPAPSTLVNGASALTRSPEIVKALSGALSPGEMGPLQRGVAEKALGTTKEGNYNFKNFQGMFGKVPQGLREALFTPEQLGQLEDIGHAGTALNTDLNPSGSARLGQGMAEGAEFLRSVPNLPELGGNIAYHGAQYGVGKMMNNPKFVDWLMQGRGFTPIAPRSFSGAPAIAMGAQSAMGSRTGPAGQPNFYSDAFLRAKAAFEAARNAQQ